MICYRDTTFCEGNGCTDFDKCPRALTKEVILNAQSWWGGPNAPIAKWETPEKLKCYKAPKTKSKKNDKR